MTIKKLICLIGVIAILFTMSVSVFAGDIPEALSYEEDAKVFIGTLKDFKIDGSVTHTVTNVEVVPTYKIKGDVALDEIQIYEVCYFGKVTPEKEKEYFFGWLSDNSVWAYEIESYNEDKITLKITDDFAERIQGSLDSGWYEKREKERLAKSEQSTQPDTSSTSVIGGADEPTDIVVKSNNSIWVIVGAGAFVLVLVAFLIMKKRKR